MHFIKTFKCIGIKLHTVFSLKLFYLLCFYGYVPRSLLMSLFVLSPLNKRLPFMGKPPFFSLYLFQPLFVSIPSCCFLWVCFRILFLASGVERFICLFSVFLASFFESVLEFFFWLLQLSASFVSFRSFLLLSERCGASGYCSSSIPWLWYEAFPLLLVSKEVIIWIWGISLPRCKNLEGCFL